MPPALKHPSPVAIGHATHVAPRWWLRLRWWWLRRHGQLPLRPVDAQGGGADGRCEVEVLERRLLELNLMLERARSKAKAPRGTPGLTG